MNPKPTTVTAGEAAKAAEDGWLVFFVRLTLADVWRISRRDPRRFLPTLGGWFSNLVIAIGQLLAHIGDWRSGFHNLIHVGVVVNGGLLEATEPRVRLVDLEERLADYPATYLVPPRHPADPESLSRHPEWLTYVEGLPYNRFGLLGVLLNLGISSPGKRFCSQLAAEYYQITGRLPKWTTVIRRGSPQAFDVPASFWEPSSLANERGAVGWSGALHVRNR
jgi:hypothetical protein